VLTWFSSQTVKNRSKVLPGTYAAFATATVAAPTRKRPTWNRMVKITDDLWRRKTRKEEDAEERKVKTTVSAYPRSNR
jgi:hypothetical protein